MNARIYTGDAKCLVFGSFRPLRQRSQRTPLHEAARHGQQDTCSLLLKRGAKRDTMDVDANEPGEDSEPSVPEGVRSQIRSMIENP